MISDKEEIDDRKPAHPVDRGWAWVILAASWCMIFITIGIGKSFGMFFIEFLRLYKASVSSTTVLTSIQTVTYCVSSILSLTCGINRITIRKLCIAGCFLNTLGYGLSSLAPSLEYLYFSFSILIGWGSGLILSPNLIIIGRYFEKRRGLSNGILFSANALGGFSLPYFFRFIFDKYGLRGALLLTAGLSSHTLLFAGLLRPPEQYRRRQKPPSPGHKELMDTEQCKALISTSEYKDSTSIVLAGTSLPVLSSNSSTKETIRPRAYSLNCKDKNGFSSQSPNFLTNDSGVTRYLSTGELVSLSVSDIKEITQNNSDSDDDINVSCLSRFKKNIFNYTILKNPIFLIFIPAYACSSVQSSFVHIFIPTYAKDLWDDDQSVTILVSMLSLSDFIGRILIGYLADKPSIKKTYLLIASQLIIGVSLNANPFYSSFWKLAIFALVLGIVSGAAMTLFVPVVIEILGHQNLGDGMVVILIFLAVFIGGTAPVLGYIRDISGTYNATLHVIGTSSLIAACLYIFLECFSVRMKSKGNRDSTV